jgi:hypothetical protein
MMGVVGPSEKGTSISIIVAVPRPKDDSRGRFTLASRDPRIPPKIEFGLQRNPILMAEVVEDPVTAARAKTNGSTNVRLEAVSAP